MNRAARPCPQPGCPELAPCPTHRQDGRAAGYDSVWAAFATAWLVGHPWCVRCAAQGRRRRAQLVDHITAVRLGGKRLDPRNVRSLCWACHNVITPREHPTARRRHR